jgi:DNA modification methylase
MTTKATKPFTYKSLPRRRLAGTTDANKLQSQDRPAHDWYRFVLSFPPHLVRDYVQRFGLRGGQRVLDPFCGTGTTVVECKKMGVASVGTEINPVAHFAGRTKTDWTPDPDGLIEHAQAVAEAAATRLARDGIVDNPVLALEDDNSPRLLKELPPEAEALLLTGSISPLPLHKTLVLLDSLAWHADARYSSHERLALAKALVTRVGNLHFGPEVGVGPAKPDVPVVTEWLSLVRSMADDLRALRDLPNVPTDVFHADSRQVARVVAPCSIDAVITSPPYPNEKDYTRTTRLESVLLGFINNKAELQALKRGLVRSNTRCVYKGDADDAWVADHPEIQRIADAIEARRIELGKTSGFERLYARVTRLYFGGMARHLAELRTVLRPGAQLAYVVGDQASFLRVMIRTGQLLADIAESLSYEVVGIDLFRTRLATATKEQLREEVVVLRWPGNR